ncbi:formylglycine-generating enzyme family protein [Beggiatoa leptomitoformis]|nr:formylglycine-generating enzyme family protein [Beggiatoa leptomitoformis]
MADSVFIQELLPPVTLPPVALDGRAKTFSLRVSWSVSIEMVLIPAGEFMMGSNNGSSDEKPVKTFSLRVSPSVNIKMVLIPAGEFMMGSEKGEDNEKPVHNVKIKQPFYMGKYPVTQAQWKAVMGDNPSYWKAVMGNNPSHWKGNNLPVENVNWADCVAFCEKLSKLSGKTIRLPSEAEWEYACRAGTTTNYWWGDSIDNNRCWYNDNSGGKTHPHPVGKKVNAHTNPFGLCDMLGNVWEWCEDKWEGNYNTLRSQQAHKSNSEYWVLRGGSWGSFANGVRSAYRYGNSTYRDGIEGFRIVFFP